MLRDLSHTFMLPFDSDLPADDAVVQVLNAFKAERAPAYIVGGAVRDHLLGISTIPGWAYQPETARLPAGGHVPTTDLDLVFSGPVLPVARRVADRLGWAFYPLDKERDVARLIAVGAAGQRLECDAAALRGDLRADLLARDFTANALALELSNSDPPQLIDVCGGVGDVEARRLRRIGPDSLSSDPIRLLRAARLAAQLAFTIEDETRGQISAKAASILAVSVERVRVELWKLLECSRPDTASGALRALGLLAHLLPEVEALRGVAQSPRHHLDAYEHSLLTMRYAAELRNWLRGGPPPADAALTERLTPWTDALRAHFAEEIAAGHDRAGWLVWHALFHDTGKAGSHPTAVEDGIAQPRYADHHRLSAQIAAGRVAHLRFSRREVLLAERVAAMHGHPRQLYRALKKPVCKISPRAAFRFFCDAGSVTGGRQIEQGARAATTPARFDGLDVTLQAISDRQATGLERGEAWRSFLEAMESLLAYTFSRPADNRTTPLVNGHILMQHLGLRPGPAVGAILRELTEAQAAGELTNVEDALALAEGLFANMEREKREGCE